MVFDVNLSIWRPRSCPTDGVKNVLLISNFINCPLFFKKINKKLKNGRNRTILDSFKNQYNNNEILIFKKYQNALKTKLPMPPKNALLRTTSNATF